MTVPLIFDESRPGRTGASFPKPEVPVRPIDELIPPKFLRSTPLRLPEVSEGTAVRHFTRLSVMNHHIDKDIYPLGSCTMKYNPKINERIARLPTIASAHPLSPPEFAQGPLRLIYELGELLKSITGFDAITLQPAAGAQSELTGLLVIRAYHHSRNNTKTHMLQPDSAHGTNPASATLAGYDSVSIPTNSEGLVDLDALKKAVNDETAGLMITNPNTLGLFEKDIEEIAEVIHSVDGLIYMDGANLNAILSIAIPALTGVDMVHVNLHKTFSTPHGGGGPGGGCLAVTGSLGKFLPTPRVVESDGRYDLSWDAPQSVG
ncbi:MAG: aminomethyl-transferring glycine dehydrogenase subunit GcvPB, partial [Candidatus Latescibacteria bacterium]|nr:aminomethyl-transferring glycine dehydrogenase subunit GcvPB [Candidatus Latescibacterota bacterium]